ncbi:NB-ARC domain, LRR domain containing protein [Trema orientale]|uniref:NB-ARC domain, LRR domain containing protein n=1 Tax=Trema orientale TaxID=63057 RepID=A0A2P5CCI3_TREOI|nr:NB-ARC domain, LRR domain containing protein [Trema orientale]
MELAAVAIQTITQAISKVVEDEVEYARGFRSQFRIMKDKLELTRALLVDKGSVENKNETLRKALTHLREVIYEADDVLIDCLIRDEYVKNATCSGCFLRYDPFFLNQTGKRLREINAQMKEKLDTLTSLGLKPMASQFKDDEDSSSQGRKIMSQDYDPEVVGLEKDLETIKGWILDPERALHRIAIVGMGGLGKTTIAQKIYHDPDVFSRFKKVVWITVSQKFNEEKILRSLLERLGGINNNFQNDTSGLMSALQETLRGNSCLIVMDDVWGINNVAWLSDLGSFLSTTVSSCVIITTRNQTLPANMGVEDKRIHKPKPLDEDNSWSLFSKFAFLWSEGKCPDSDFDNVGRKIVKKCGGLPLAIKVIGGLLQSKSKNLAAWEEVSNSFLDQSQTTEDEVMANLRLSYNDLPAHLKQCLLCLSIYPEDSEIWAEQLIRWWIAEGLIKEKSAKTAIESGYQYLLELINRSLVEIAEHRHYDGRVYKCKVHDLIRELIMKIAEEEGFCRFKENGTCYWSGLIDETDKEWLSNNLKLRALFVLTPRCPDFDRNSVSLLSLRVLDFSGTGNLDEQRVKNLLDWIGSLKRLACLNLSKAEGLLELPSTICKLFNLQFLVLRECYNLNKIHPSIINLKNLIVLDMASCRLEYFPGGLGSLSHLQELSGFRVVIGSTKSNGHGLGELRSLTRLRVLGIVISTTVPDAKISEKEFNILSAMAKLEVLAVNTDRCKQKRVLETVERSLIPPPSLRELYLKKYCFETMPSWFDPKTLRNLQYLCIEDADIESLIPRRETDTPEYKWYVKGLCLKSLCNLEVEWEELEKVMRLQSLEVSKCSELKLKRFPCSVNEAGHWTRKQD